MLQHRQNLFRGTHAFPARIPPGRDPRQLRMREGKIPDRTTKDIIVLNADGSRIESVYMPMRDRTSICLSSQAGCAVGCTFCVTGFFGAGRNLTPSEMLGQFFIVQHEKAIPSEQMLSSRVSAIIQP